jgi:hypothetical protein
MHSALKKLAVTAFVTAAMLAPSFANDRASKEAADNRTKVATAVALANIAMAEKDGEALLVATRLLASAGPVAKLGESASSGQPALYDIGALATSAKELGADAAKADEVAKMGAAPTSSVRGYWYYSCDSYNNCMWIWVGD